MKHAHDIGFTLFFSP